MNEEIVEEAHTDAMEDEERRQLRFCRSHYGRDLCFPAYESFFRTFCRNSRWTAYDFALRADFESFRKGITRWYGNRENLPLTELLYNFFGKGKVNHLVTFSEFLGLVRDLKLQKHENLLIFRLLSERRSEMDIL